MRDEALGLVQGTLDLLILQTLCAGAAHGYGISQTIREKTAERITVKDAALYQALRRLEGRRWVEAEWGLSDNNRKARFYSLTASGRKQLRVEVDEWKRYAEAVFMVLG